LMARAKNCAFGECHACCQEVVGKIRTRDVR
jgi:hypothetical protein